MRNFVMRPKQYGKIIGVQVYLELKKSRLFVGVLKKVGEKFIFCYEQKYLRERNAIPLGPEMPLTRLKYESERLFVPFTDRIPTRENPAYPDYCRTMGIDVNEDDPMVVLSTIARRGPSSFIFEPIYKDTFTAEDLLAFRHSLKLSVKEFAEVFDFSSAAITRVERKQSSGREILKRAEIYAHYPEVTLDQIRYRSWSLHSTKQMHIESLLKNMIQKEETGAF